jgi:hypothetical protein
MRILDYESDKSLNNICIYLTPSEAKEMADSLQGLAAGEIEHHVHIADSSLDHEVTVAVYTDSNLSTFDQRSIRLIAGDA